MVIKKGKVRIFLCFWVAFFCFLCPNAVLSAQIKLDRLPLSKPDVVASNPPSDVHSFVISALDPLWPSKKMFGSLEWVGGLRLVSDNPCFGGFSSLEWIDKTNFIAISDRGCYLRSKMIFSGGHPKGLVETRLDYLPGFSRKTAKWKMDAEGFSLGSHYGFVSFEGSARLMRYPFRNGDLYRGASLPLSGKARSENRNNSGLEAIALAPASSPLAGSLILFSEDPQKGTNTIPGWIYRRGKTQSFHIQQKGSFDVTDAAFTAQGDLVVLERAVSLLGGFSTHIRRIKAKDIVAGNTLPSETLFEGNQLLRLDNMEGIAIQDLGDGTSLLTLISDDNFSRLQDTILLQFRLR